VIAAPLFERVYAAHVRVLQSLSPEQWQIPTVCTGWSVHDVALHLLGGDVGWLSGGRDGYREAIHTEIRGWDDLIGFINLRNEVWVRAMRRMSTQVLCDLIPILGSMVIDYVNTLDPFAPGPAINWAGDDPAPMWMQIGRELTERWTHHQHICDAVGVVSLKESDMVHTVLDMFVRALPHTYRNVAAPDGTRIILLLAGISGGEWNLLREDGVWRLYSRVDGTPASTVTMSTETAWRLFTKGIGVEEGRQATSIDGDVELGEPILHMVSILA
jgi:uncharacterized protein (TIGR03083 family)